MITKICPTLQTMTNMNASQVPKQSSMWMEIHAQNNNQAIDFFPVDSGQSDRNWPLIPKHHWDYMPRIFYPWNSTHSWCQRMEEDQDSSLMVAGLIYVKVHKAASSTLAGITLRVAHNFETTDSTTTNSNTTATATATASRRRTRRRRRGGKKRSEKGKKIPCASHQQHGDSHDFQQRDRSRSFMFTSIRDPTQRALSWIFYVSSNTGAKLDDLTVKHRLQARNYFPKKVDSDLPKYDYKKEAGAQVGYLHTGPNLDQPLWSPTEPTKIQNVSLALERVHQVLQQYDFIMIVERLYESLVVFQLLLNLSTSDILYLSASKQSGSDAYSYNYGGRRPGCYHIAKSVVSPEVATFVSSPEWYAQNYQDYVLYQAANRSLDMTIANLGQERFQKALQTFQTMMKQAHEACEGEVVTPCSADGVPNNETNCYYRDWGCGYPCLDHLFGTGERGG